MSARILTGNVARTELAETFALTALIRLIRGLTIGAVQ